MSLICALILKVTPEVLGLADLIVVFQKLLAQMQEIVKRSTRAEETPEMQSLDQKRDSLFTYVSTAIANAEKSPVAAQKNAYQVLMIDFLPYYKIGLAYDKNISETAQLTGFVHDMSKTTNLAQIKILGLDAALNELDTTNKAYEALMTSRLNSVTQDDLGPSKDIRFKMDDVYDMMKDVVNAKNVVVIKRGKGTGFAGIENALFYADNARMLYGDGAEMASQLVSELKALDGGH